MRKIAFCILLISFLFASMPIDAFASDGDIDALSDDDDDDNTHSGSHHTDYIEEELARRGYIAQSYEDIIDFISHIDWHGNTFVITNLEDVSSGAKSPKKAVQDIGYAFQNDSSIDNIFKSNIDIIVNSQNGYVTVRCIPSSMMSSLMPQGHMSAAANICNNQKLTIASGGLHPYRDASASVDVSDYTFIMDSNPNEVRSDWNVLYNDMVGYNNSKQQYNRYYVVNASFDRFNYQFTTYHAFGLAPDTMYNYNMSMYGSLSSGDYWQWNCLVYSDVNFSTVPIFKDVTSARLFLNGGSPFYNLPYLTTLDDDTINQFDFDKLRRELKNAIDQGDWLTANDLQAIINQTLLKELEIMGMDIKDILLSLRYGLFDDLGIPYLKTINENVQIIVDNLNMSGGYDDTVLITKLDEIIGLLKVSSPSLPGGSIDLPSPDDLPEDVSDLVELLKDTASGKFPFSIVNDIQLVVILFKAEPIKPDLNFEIQLPFTDEPVNWYIDLVWFDEFRDYWLTFCSIAFLVFLLAISIKIIDGLKV